jgi:hypothetical protein
MKLLHLTESVDVAVGANAEEVKDKALKMLESKGGVVVPTIEAIHSAITRNCTFYGPQKLRGKNDFVHKETGKVRPTGVFSWTTPYRKPMLLNHDIWVDPLGRMLKAEYKQKTSKGTPGIICYPEIIDPEAAIKVLDGRYNTVSIGADTDGAYCSICNKNQLVDWCDHRRGQMYEGKLCYWNIGNIWFEELSFVNAPSDENAGIIEIPEVKESAGVEMGFLLQDLKENKLYDLTNDEVYAITNNGLALIPRTEYVHEYFYIPFNFKLDESVQTSEQGRITVAKEKETKVSNEEDQVQGQETENADQDVENKDKGVEVPSEANSEEVNENAQEESQASESQEAEGNGQDKDNAGLIEHVKALAISLGIISETSEKEEDNPLEGKIAELQGTIDTLTRENEALVAEAATLRAEATKSLVEQIVKRKLELGDITEEEVEAERTKMSERNNQSLVDTLDDLGRRKVQVTRQIEKVTNPALADNSQEGVIPPDGEKSITKEERKKDEKPVEVKVFKSLLTGEKDVTKFKGGNK